MMEKPWTVNWSFRGMQTQSHWFVSSSTNHLCPFCLGGPDHKSQPRIPRFVASSWDLVKTFICNYGCIGTLWLQVITSTTLRCGSGSIAERAHSLSVNTHPLYMRLSNDRSLHQNLGSSSGDDCTSIRILPRKTSVRIDQRGQAEKKNTFRHSNPRFQGWGVHIEALNINIFHIHFAQTVAASHYIYWQR